MHYPCVNRTLIAIIALLNLALTCLSQVRIKAEETSGGLPVENDYVFFHAGSFLLNPYRIVNTNELQVSDSEAAFFVEFVANYVWAWDPKRRVASGIEMNRSWSLLEGWQEPLDVQGRIGYVIHTSDDETPTASTIVGAGEFSVEATVSLALYRQLSGDTGADPSDAGDFYEKTSWAHSLNLVGSYGAVTDRGAFDVHHRVFLGLGWTAAFKSPLQPDGSNVKREGVFSIRMGEAWIEETRFLDSSTRQIELTQGDIPKYTMEPGFAFEAELLFPIKKNTFLTLGTRIYGGHDPNPWNASIGITWGLDKLAGLIPD